MNRAVLLILLIATFTLAIVAQESNILSNAEKNPRSSQVQDPDGTWRTPKYGDHHLEQAANRLKNFPQPFTVSRVVSWYSQSKDPKIRASFLRVLAVSRDPRAAVVLGASLNDNSLDVRIAATYGLMDYFLPSVVDGGTEQHMAAVHKWWTANRERLEREARCAAAESEKALCQHTPQQ
jgi:hypothetical protein